MSKVLIDGQALYQAANALEELMRNTRNELDISTAISGHHNIETLEEMIHNLSDQDLFFPKHYGSTSIYDSLMNLVYCIILWDEIFVLGESCISYVYQGVGFFKHFGVEFTTISGRESELPHDIQGLALEHFFEKRYEAADKSEPNLALKGEPYYATNHKGDRAIRYLLFANANGMDYMPSIERQILLQSYDVFSLFYRNDVINKLDDVLKDYYSQVNSHLSQSRFTYKFPVILDYILEKYNSIADVIKAAYDLKNKSETIRFRSELDNLSNEFKSGNVRYVEEYFLNIEKLLLDLRKTLFSDKSIDVTIGFPPSVTFSIEGKQGKPFQSVFLKDLICYGIKSRVPKPPPNWHEYVASE